MSHPQFPFPDVISIPQPTRGAIGNVVQTQTDHLSGDLSDRPANHPPQATRLPVDFRYDALNPAFLKMLARIGAYADEKYGSWAQYTQSRLTGEKSPVNHIHEHLRAYVMGEKYDHFDGDPRWHLAAIAYNAMMSFYYHSKWGPEQHPLHLDEKKPNKVNP